MMDGKKDSQPNSPLKKDKQSSPGHSRRKSIDSGKRSRSRSRNSRKKRDEEIRHSSSDLLSQEDSESNVDSPDITGYHSETEDGNMDDISEVQEEQMMPSSPSSGRDSERPVSRLKRTLSGKLRGSSNKVESGPPPVDDTIHKSLSQTTTTKQFSKLLRRTAHIDQTDGKGQSLLHLCASRGLLDCMRILLKKGSNINLQDAMGYTPLHCAAIERKLDSCKLLIESKNIDVTLATNEQANVLHYLVRTPVDESNLVLYRNVLDLLIDKGINVNVGNKHNEAPIHFACMKSNIQTVAFLLERGADCNLKTTLNETPLHYAVRAGNIKLVRMLMESGADPTAQSVDDNTTPVDVAEQYQCTDILDCLQSIIEEELFPDNNSSIVSPRVRLNESTIVKESELDVFWKDDWCTFFVQLNKHRIICKEEKGHMQPVFTMDLSHCTVMAEEGTIMSDSGEQLWCYSVTEITGSIISFATTIPEEREYWIDAIQSVILERKQLFNVYDKLKAQSKPRKRLRIKERNLGIENCRRGIKKLKESNEAKLMCKFIVNEPELASAALWKIMSMERDTIFISLVKYLLHMDKFEIFLKSAISHEIRISAVGETLFREMSLCTRMLSCYLDMEPGKDYLRSTVISLLNDISSATNVQDNLENIAALSQRFLDHILSSPNRCPYLFRELMRHTRERVDKVYPNMTHAVVGGFVFLRFICPAIISPHKFGLTKTPNHARKDAVLITKLLQTVSNGVEFDESREGTLQQLNPFIRKNRLFVDVFFDSLTDPISIAKQKSTYVPPKKLSNEEVENLESVIFEHMCQYRERMDDLLNEKIRICIPLAEEGDDSDDQNSEVEVDSE